jgi:Mn2+/Fe2+ NRAMP family transporter
MSDVTTSRPRYVVLRSIGLGLISGAADDDCSAIGTYIQAGAQLGYKALWTAPVAFPMMVVHDTLIPAMHFDRTTLAILVAIVGSSLSTYLCVWQSNQEVEEKEAEGKHTPRQRRGTTDEELKANLKGTIFGMFFSSAVMYFIILASAATLFVRGNHSIATAQQAAESLKPFAGRAAGLLFTVGIVGTGFLAVSIMTTGAAYALSQSFGWENGLYHGPASAKKFYAAISVFMLIAMGMNFIGINPMHALVAAGIVQGFSTPPIMLSIMILTNRRTIMGDKVKWKTDQRFGSDHHDCHLSGIWMSSFQLASPLRQIWDPLFAAFPCSLGPSQRRVQ